MYCSTEEVKSLINRAFPDFRGKRIQVLPFQGPMQLTSYWSGGSRDYWAILPLTDSDGVWQAPESGTPFTPGLAPLTALPAGFALVQLTRGPYEYAAVYVNAENLTKMLPAPVELTDDEKTVLKVTKNYLSSYGGQSNYRFLQSGLTQLAYDTAKCTLIEKGLLNRAGAITNAGRNAIAQ